MKSLSRVRLPATPWTAAYQAPPSMGFSRQESWSGVPLPSPRTKRNGPDLGPGSRGCLRARREGASISKHTWEGLTIRPSSVSPARPSSRPQLLPASLLTFVSRTYWGAPHSPSSSREKERSPLPSPQRAEGEEN